MKNKQKTILDLKGCKYLDELHARIRDSLHFPDWYGKNWDALWDSLQDLPEEYTDVEITGFYSLPKDLQTSGEKMIEIMQENKEEHDEYLKSHPQFGYRFDYCIID